jgi:hypothetical protein
MILRNIGLSLVLLALPGCGGQPQAQNPDGSVSGPVTEIDRLLPHQNDTVFSYVTTDDAGATGIYVLEVARPRSTLAELTVAGKVYRRFISRDGVQAASGGFVLRAPLFVGAEWSGEFGNVKVKSMSRAIKVPAGEFNNCVETYESAKTPDFTKSATSVFCPGIGMVYYLLEGEQDGVAVSQKLELKSWGPRFVAGLQK